MVQTPTIEVLVQEWREAFNAHDLDRHMAFYAQDATLFGAIGELQVGRDKIRAYFGARPKSVQCKAYPVPRIRQLGPNAAITAGYVEFADADTPMPYRMTWALEKRDGNWIIAQHHGSPRIG